jgi:hypothetical protein
MFLISLIFFIIIIIVISVMYNMEC